MLRYPGGKLRIMKKIDETISDYYQEAKESDWVISEPFTGGGGSLLNMAKDFPKWKFHINDLNPDVSSMWQFFFKSKEKDFQKLYSLIHNQKVNVSEHSRIFESNPKSLLQKTFKVIFLNKTSFSGFITKKRPIGGKDQSGKWKIDIYWNPKTIVKGIEKMRNLLRGRILSVSCLDFESFLKDKKNDFIYADPPYIALGKEWYNCSFNLKDLERLRNILYTQKRWCLSIDKSIQIEEIYKESHIGYLNIKHTAKSSYKSKEIDENKKIATAQELLIFSSNALEKDMNFLF